jgi:hypothetical protein
MHRNFDAVDGQAERLTSLSLRNGVGVNGHVQLAGVVVLVGLSLDRGSSQGDESSGEAHCGGMCAMYSVLPVW